MSEKEHLIAGIRQNRDMLTRLLDRFEEKGDLDPADFHVYEATAREVEGGLKRLRFRAVDEMVKDFRLHPFYLN